MQQLRVRGFHRSASQFAGWRRVFYQARQGGISGNKLKLMLQKREAPVPTKTKVAVDENKAKEFLGSLKRQKRQLWDRTRPEVQQWYQQFLYMGFDEAKFEDDITYWLNRDRNGHEYYGDYYQRHYEEDSAIGPRSPYGFRHGASVNYDDY
ncbi:augurin isoform X1 [Pan paniscus]|uniref:augurin isoform X1 n=1 Tax=Pan paniscus TaxID=9597 RepID=UPI0004F049DC|nr:augurin isoform X1 [Pan paniscus]XP_054963470.1 augurin isoform X1 [Pan paniscus]XP_054963471.1 augurin isoform X1 [Pan paniscus]